MPKKQIFSGPMLSIIFLSIKLIQLVKEITKLPNNIWTNAYPNSYHCNFNRFSKTYVNEMGFPLTIESQPHIDVITSSIDSIEQVLDYPWVIFVFRQRIEPRWKSWNLKKYAFCDVLLDRSFANCTWHLRINSCRKAMVTGCVGRFTCASDTKRS